MSIGVIWNLKSHRALDTRAMFCSRRKHQQLISHANSSLRDHATFPLPFSFPPTLAPVRLPLNRFRSAAIIFVNLDYTYVIKRGHRRGTVDAPEPVQDLQHDVPNAVPEREEQRDVVFYRVQGAPEAIRLPRESRSVNQTPRRLVE